MQRPLMTGLKPLTQRAAAFGARPGTRNGSPWVTLELLVIGFICLVYAGPIWPVELLFHVGDLALEGSSPVSQAQTSIVILFLAVSAIFRPALFARALSLGWPILGLVLVALCSAAWSDAPALVLRRATVMGVTTVSRFTCRFGCRCHSSFACWSPSLGCWHSPRWQ